MNTNEKNNFSSFFYPFLWTAPFICFFVGYFSLSFFMPQESLCTPSLLGKSSTQGLSILSEYNLSAQIISVKEDDTLPEGTIIAQTPQPSTKIKSHQTIYLVISKKPTYCTTPNFLTLPLQDCIKEAKTHHLKLRIHPITHTGIQNTCIAQIPDAHTLLNQDSVNIYVTDTSNQMVLMPNIKNKTVQEVKEYFSSFLVTITTHHTTSLKKYHECTDCIIKDQKPLAGSLVCLQKPLRVQLII